MSIERAEKVKTLKEKILSEINSIMRRYSWGIYSYSGSNYRKGNFFWFDDENYEHLINVQFILIALKKYTLEENSFQEISKYSEVDGHIIYRIPIRMLDIWLQKDFCFTDNFMRAILEDENNILNISYFLNDSYFAYEFTSIVDEVLFDFKEQEEKSNES